MDTNTQIGDNKMTMAFRNVNKSYDKGKVPILKNFSMNVPKGSVYSLLGASGCGKTTVIKIAVGLLRFSGGDVQVLGGTPGQKDSGIPGPRVGFMPQECALVGEFTVSETMYYFGWLFGMTNSEIAERYDFLAELLQLPPGGRRVVTLSGGEQRRLSFAVAVIHSPELLIVDEPTVGLDPILRDNLWIYMLKLSSEQKVTIFLTTHYIEEAKQSQRIGLMRNGVLLAETSPNQLMSKYSCDNIEEVFLLLSQAQSRYQENTADQNKQIQDPGASTSSEPAFPLNDAEVSSQSQTLAVSPVTKCATVRQRSSRARMKSLIYKNALKTLRNKESMTFNFIYTIIYMFAFFVGIGHDPHSLPVGVVNEELGNCDTLPGGFWNHSGAVASRDEEDEIVCTLKGMSCLFLNELNGDTINIRYYDTLEDGLSATRKSETFATLFFSKDFTEAQQERFDDPLAATNSTLSIADVRAWIDMSEYTIGNNLKLRFQDKMVDFFKNIAKRCNLSENTNVLPIRFEDPVYGDMATNFIAFMAPGMIMAVFLVCNVGEPVLSYSSIINRSLGNTPQDTRLMYSLPVLLTSNEVVTERTEGLWNRNLVAGVHEFEIISAHLLIQLIVTFLQMVEVYIFGVYVYHLEILGSVPGSALMIVLHAICGASMGILISVVTNNISQSMILSMSSFLPYVTVCGISWPVEGMYPWVQNIVYLLPATWPIAALRNVFSRGWPLTHVQVFPGFIASIVWFSIFTTLSVVGLKRSKY